MLSESGWGMFVGGQGSCLAQQRTQSRCKANGYYGVVPTAETAVSLLDNLKICLLGPPTHHALPSIPTGEGPD
jgi:hypothetical protein